MFYIQPDSLSNIADLITVNHYRFEITSLQSVNLFLYLTITLFKVVVYELSFAALTKVNKSIFLLHHYYLNWES